MRIPGACQTCVWDESLLDELPDPLADPPPPPEKFFIVSWTVPLTHVITC